MIQTQFRVQSNGERDANPAICCWNPSGSTERPRVISLITVIELEHGLRRANTPALARQQRAYLDTIFLAIPVEPFTKEMAQLAAKITHVIAP